MSDFPSGKSSRRKGDPGTYHVDVLDENCLTVSVDLGNHVDLALVLSTDDADSITGGEKDMSPLLVFGETWRVQNATFQATICSAVKSGISHGCKWTLLPILPAILPCLLELRGQCGAKVLPRPLGLDAIQQFLSFLSLDGSFEGLLPGGSRPLDNSLHLGVGVQQWPNVVSAANTPIRGSKIEGVVHVTHGPICLCNISMSINT